MTDPVLVKILQKEIYIFISDRAQEFGTQKHYCEVKKINAAWNGFTTNLAISAYRIGSTFIKNKFNCSL